MHACMPANSIFDGPVTDLLALLCILIEILTHSHAKWEKALAISDLAFLFVVFQVSVQQAWQ